MPYQPVPAEVREMLTRLAEPVPMRRGSLSERFVKCSRTGCPCSDNAEARHGPYFSLSRVVKGKTRSRWLKAEQAKLVRAQVEAGQQFRRQIEAYWEVCERWADSQLKVSDTTSSTEAAKKRASKRPSGRK